MPRQQKRAGGEGNGSDVISSAFAATALVKQAQSSRASPSKVSGEKLKSYLMNEPGDYTDFAARLMKNDPAYRQEMCGFIEKKNLLKNPMVPYSSWDAVNKDMKTCSFDFKKLYCEKEPVLIDSCALPTVGIVSTPMPIAAPAPASAEMNNSSSDDVAADDLLQEISSLMANPQLVINVKNANQTPLKKVFKFTFNPNNVARSGEQLRPYTDNIGKTFESLKNTYMLRYVNRSEDVLVGMTFETNAQACGNFAGNQTRECTRVICYLIKGKPWLTKTCGLTENTFPGYTADGNNLIASINIPTSFLNELILYNKDIVIGLSESGQISMLMFGNSDITGGKRKSSKPKSKKVSVPKEKVKYNGKCYTVRIGAKGGRYIVVGEKKKYLKH